MSGGKKDGDDGELEAELDEEQLEDDELEDDELGDEDEEFKEIDEALIDLDDEYDDPDVDDRPHSPHRYEE
jgi:ribonuclease E